MLFLDYADDFLSGLLTTVAVSVTSFAGGMVLGVLGALARRSRWLVLRFVGGLYVEVVRNIPGLVLLFFVFFGLPALGLYPPAVVAGVVALAVNAGAYLTEIIRSGFAAVPDGQAEAGRTLGLSGRDTFWFVTLPQALRIVYPPVVGEFLQIILGSSLLAVIAVEEITGTALIINGITFRTIEVFATALVLYLLLNNVVALGADLLSRVFFPAPQGQQPSVTSRRTRRRLMLVAGGR